MKRPFLEQVNFDCTLPSSVHNLLLSLICALPRDAIRVTYNQLFSAAVKIIAAVLRASCSGAFFAWLCSRLPSAAHQSTRAEAGFHLTDSRTWPDSNAPVTEIHWQKSPTTYLRRPNCGQIKADSLQTWKRIWLRTNATRFQIKLFSVPIFSPVTQ